MWTRITAALALAVISSPAASQNSNLDDDVEAGRLLYIGETQRHDCSKCHALDGSGTDVGANVQGDSVQDIQIAIMAQPTMYTIKLTEEELVQLELYLKHLQDTAH